MSAPSRLRSAPGSPRCPRPRLAAVLAALVAFACGGAPDAPPHRGPIVLITLDALRADVVGALGGPPGLTPHLDGLAAEASWVGPAISTSSWTVPSMASLMTGLQPFRHGNWHGDRAVLDEEHLTLAEALAATGYRTAAFRSNHWLQEKYGYAQGFETFRYLGHGRRAERALAGLDGGAELVWIHILPPHAPYVRREHLLERLPVDLARPSAADLPERVRPVDLEPYYDPQTELPETERATFWALYLLNVAWADQQLGRYLDALRKSGWWDHALVVVTSDHGEEFGEYGQVVHGGSLGRVLIEVPLVIKEPAGSLLGERLRSLAAPPSNGRLWATLLEAVGAPQPAGEILPSLTDVESAAAGALSELYLGNGTNQFSWVDPASDRQLVWTSRFAAPNDLYYAARRQSLGAAPGVPLPTPPDEIFARQREQFDRVPPLSGLAGRRPELALYRWADGTSERIEDPAGERRLAALLRERWSLANGEEGLPGQRGEAAQPSLTPEEIERLKALGYVGG